MVCLDHDQHSQIFDNIVTQFTAMFQNNKYLIICYSSNIMMSLDTWLFPNIILNKQNRILMNSPKNRITVIIQFTIPKSGVFFQSSWMEFLETYIVFPTLLQWRNVVGLFIRSNLRVNTIGNWHFLKVIRLHEQGKGVSWDILSC